jgi:hypothetical protein
VHRYTHFKLDEPNKETFVIQEADEIFTAFAGDISQLTAEYISSVTSRQPNTPAQYKDFFSPNGAGATIVFRTETGEFVLGGIRQHPALDGLDYPQQIIATY